MSIEQSVASHYTHGSLASKILDALRDVVDDPDHMTIDDLAPVDEFHIGGREASERFIGQLGFTPRMHVLDAGAGIGGTARFVARSTGCRLSALDITQEFCDVGALLTEKVGLSDRVTHHQGSVLDMPFATATFDGVYSVHVGMNIEDKPGLYREVRRVLKPGGVFGIYDILRGQSDSAFEFPVPWATTAATSFLASRDEVGEMLEAAGFRIESGTDQTQYAIDWFRERQRRATEEPPTIGTHLLMRDAKTKFANTLRNHEQGRCGPWEIICRLT